MYRSSETIVSAALSAHSPLPKDISDDNWFLQGIVHGSGFLLWDMFMLQNKGQRTFLERKLI